MKPRGGDLLGDFTGQQARRDVRGKGRANRLNGSIICLRIKPDEEF